MLPTSRRAASTRPSRRSPTAPAPSRAAPTSWSVPGRARSRCPTRSSRSTASTRCAASPPPAAGCGSARSSTHEELESHPVIRERFTGLADASAIVGSHATRANGTIGGNVMNASPAMDTGAPLICLGASAVLQGPGGTRSLAGRGAVHGARPDDRVAGRAPDRGRPAGARRRHRLGVRPARVPPPDGDRDRRRRRRGHDRGRQGDGGARSPSRRSRRPSTGSPAAEEALVGTDGGRAAATRRRRRGGGGVPRRSPTSAAPPTTAAPWRP